MSLTTPKQVQFKADMERAGFEVRVHPLHGMRETYAVECRVKNAGVLYGDDGDQAPHVQDVYRATKLRLDSDQLGYNVVLYPVL